MQAYAYSRGRLTTEAEMMAQIVKKNENMNQPLAYVHPRSIIAKNVVIEPSRPLIKMLRLEKGLRLDQTLRLWKVRELEKIVLFFPGSVISAVPQDLKFNGEDSTAEIGDNTTIRECVTINRGTSSRGKTIIGENCLVMAYSHST